MRGPAVASLAAIALVTPDADRLAAFYETALGFARIADRRIEAGDCGEETILSLGSQTLELLQFHRPGRPYPAGVDGNDLRFQHLAIVVADMAAAFGRLQGAAGWSTISDNGPVSLPASSGGVTAFKFRDPDGHPLELLAFPSGGAPEVWRRAGGLLLGIDHSAISVADTARSIAFYQDLGLTMSARSHNFGDEQARLDGLAGAEADVVTLSPAAAAPHIELLGYRTPRPRMPEAVGPRDVAATRLIFSGDPPVDLSDPDGHRLIVRPRRPGP